MLDTAMKVGGGFLIGVGTTMLVQRVFGGKKETNVADPKPAQQQQPKPDTTKPAPEAAAA